MCKRKKNSVIPLQTQEYLWLLCLRMNTLLVHLSGVMMSYNPTSISAVIPAGHTHIWRLI